MTAQHTSLDGLRREIDQIDDQIHDLIMHRVEVVRRIGSLKGDDGISLRPAREAMILRRLAARHDGSLPLPVLLRMWRELLSGTTRVQGPFAVAVYAPEDRRGFWDIARDHFGSFTPMTAVNTPVAAVRAVSEGSATVGIVPWPEEEERDPWWRYLLGEDQTTPRIVARLPERVEILFPADDVGHPLGEGRLHHPLRPIPPGIRPLDPPPQATAPAMPSCTLNPSIPDHGPRLSATQSTTV